jgi:hypothetical protein
VLTLSWKVDEGKPLSNGTSYHYSNTDGSYYYQNDNGELEACSARQRFPFL